MIRCDRHIGSTWPVRCDECDLALIRHAAELVEAKMVRFIPNSHCPRHPLYPMPCASCAREVLEKVHA